MATPLIPKSFPPDFIGPRITNDQLIALKKRAYFVAHREQFRASQAKYRAKNRKELNARAAIKASLEREHHRERGREYYAKNRSAVNARHRAYYAAHRRAHIIRGNKYRKKRLQNDLGFRIEKACQCRIWGALFDQKTVKSLRTLALIGCSIPELRRHLESRFLPGMSWENYGYRGWHIDHIRPCASFDLTDVEQQKKCFRFSNLQPLWRKQNQEKSDSVGGP